MRFQPGGPLWEVKVMPGAPALGSDPGVQPKDPARGSSLGVKPRGQVQRVQP